MYTREVNGVALPPLYSRLLALLSLQSVCLLRFPSLRLTCCPPFSCTTFHQSNPSVGSFSFPFSSTALVFTLSSLRFPPLRLPGCPPIFIAYALHRTRLHLSVTSFPSLCLPRCPPFSCATFHYSNPWVGSFSSPMSSTTIVFTLPSLRFPPLRLPGCPPIFITYILRRTFLHPSVLLRYHGTLALT